MNQRVRLSQLMSLCLALVAAFQLKAQTALVQVIHNSPDPSLETIQVMIDDAIILDSLPFHYAGAMSTVDTASAAIIRIFAASDTALGFPILQDTVSLSVSSKHIFVLSGTAESNTFQPHVPLHLDHLANARDVSEGGNGLDITFCHSATDIDSIDITESALFELTAFEDVTRGEFTEYLSLFSIDYAFTINDAASGTPIGDYAAPFGSLNWAGKAITVVSGGFLNQTLNNNSLPFGLWATTRDGGPLICLQPNQLSISAPVQWIHASSAGVAADIRISANGITWEDHLSSFHSTPFTPFPAAQPVHITVHSNLLQSPLDSIWSDSIYLYSGQSYRILFLGNGSVEFPFELKIDSYNPSVTVHQDSVRIDFVHAASCYSEISISADTLLQSPVAEHLAYGNNSSFFNLVADNDEWVVRSNGDSLTTWIVPFENAEIAGSSITCITSDDGNCPSITAWLCSALGGPMTPLEVLVIPPPVVFVHLQFIHACADASLSAIDVYINDSLLLANWNFRSATPFLDIPVNDTLHITITPVNGDPLTQSFLSDLITLSPNQHYRATLAGITASIGYNPSPDVRWILSGVTFPNAGSNSTVLQFAHAATDAGSMLVQESTTPIVPLFGELSFGEVSYSTTLSAENDYALGVFNSDVNFLYGTFALPISAWNWTDQSIFLLASGFRQPLNNSNGPSYALHAIGASGELTLLSNYVAIAEEQHSFWINCYPNPVAQELTIELETPESGTFSIQITDAQGRMCFLQENITCSGSKKVSIPTNSWMSGNYTLDILDANKTPLKDYHRLVIVQR